MHQPPQDGPGDGPVIWIGLTLRNMTEPARDTRGYHVPVVPGYQGDPGDATADAMAALHTAILALVSPAGLDRAEEMLSDLLALYGGDELPDEERDETIARVLGLPGAKPAPPFDTAEHPVAQLARDSLEYLACPECGVEADAAGRLPQPDGHLTDCSRYEEPGWEVAPGDVVIMAASSAEQAAARAAAEIDYEASDRHYEQDPNPRLYVRRGGSTGPWRAIIPDEAAVAAEVAALKAEE